MPLSSACLLALLGVTLLLLSVNAEFDFERQQERQAQDTCASQAPRLVLKGKKFFNSITGEYVPIKGVDYYPRPNQGDLTISNSVDFFHEEMRPNWERDIAMFKSLNINAIRLYGVDPGKFHGSFMCALKQAGIYVIVGLAADCFECAIGKVAAPACYPAALKERGEFIISVFSKYDNVLAFSAGNEAELVVVPAAPEVNGPCQKKFIRDMRAYIQSCPTMRQVPVGVVVADIDREEKALYYGCRSDPQDELENAEFLGLNTYVHCDGAAAEVDDLVGYRVLVEDFEKFGLNIPVMTTEYGCVNPSFPTIDGYQAQRTWLQAEALFTPRFREEFAGGFVFEYSTERVYSTAPWPFTQVGKGNFGIGYFSPENCDGNQTACDYIPFPQFDLLAAKYGAVDISGEPSLDEYVARNNPVPACPVQYRPLASFVWASDSKPSIGCPRPEAIYCPGIDPVCTVIPPPTEPFPTGSPTKFPSMTPTKTDAPVVVPTLQPVAAVTQEPVAATTPQPVAQTATPAPVTTAPTMQPEAETQPTPVDPPVVIDNGGGNSSDVGGDDGGVVVIPDSQPTSSPVEDDGENANGLDTANSESSASRLSLSLSILFGLVVMSCW